MELPAILIENSEAERMIGRREFKIRQQELIIAELVRKVEELEGMLKTKAEVLPFKQQ